MHDSSRRHQYGRSSRRVPQNQKRGTTAVSSIGGDRVSKTRSLLRFSPFRHRGVRRVADYSSDALAYESLWVSARPHRGASTAGDDPRDIGRNVHAANAPNTRRAGAIYAGVGLSNLGRESPRVADSSQILSPSQSWLWRRFSYSPRDSCSRFVAKQSLALPSAPWRGRSAPVG